MKILDKKFEYGNKSISFDEERMYVDYCENNKDLTYFEELLGEGNYSCYTIECKTGGKVNGKIKTMWALVTKEEFIFQWGEYVQEYFSYWN